MLIRRCLLGGLQLFILCQMDLVYGYYRHQRKIIEEIDWSYTGTLNQKNWVKKYPACNGAKQSPINIDEDLTQVSVNLKKLIFQGWDQESSGDTVIRNTGKTVEINLKNDYLLTGGALDAVYKASKISFHWGKCNASSDGSEHSLDGRKFPLEMQIYCYNAELFKSFDEAVQENGKIKALSILYEISPEDNMEYSAIIDGVDNVSRFGKQATLEMFILLNLLPNYTDKYFIYNGSLSSPPCTETVEWIVFKDTVKISESQLEYFCDVMTMQQSGYVMLMDYLQNNFREQQYQFFGQVFSSYTGKEEIHETVCSSEAENVQAEPKNYSSLLVTWERPRVVYDAIIERFAVYYQQLDGDDQPRHELLTDGYQDLGAILNDLLPNTSYVLQVVAVCSNGLYGKHSDQVIVDMPLDDPDIDLFSDLEETEDVIEVICCSFLHREEKLYKKDQRNGITSVEDPEEEQEDNDSTYIKNTADNQIWNQEPAHTTPDSLQERMGTETSLDHKVDYPIIVSTHAIDGALQKSTPPTSTGSSPIAGHDITDRMDPKEQMLIGVTTSKGIDVQAISVVPYRNISYTTKDLSEDGAHGPPVTEQQEITTAQQREFLTPGNWPDQSHEVFLDVTPTVSSTQFVLEEVSLEKSLASQSSDTRLIGVTQGYPTDNSKDLTSSREDDRRIDAGEVFDNVINETATSSLALVAGQVNETSDTGTTANYSAASVLLQGTLVAGAGMQQNFASTFSPTELASHSVATTSGKNSASASEGISQTSQPVSHGEIPIHPSYANEALLLRTPLLSDTQFHHVSPAFPSLAAALHATPVLPSLDVSLEPTLSSSDDIRLLPFSSASFGGKFHHVFTVSKMLLKSTPAIMSDTLPLHASLALTDSGTLIQSQGTLLADVISHRLPHVAPEALESPHETSSLHEMSMVPQVVTSETDVKMHVPSTVGGFVYPVSSDVAFLHSVPASDDSSTLVHDSIGVLHEGLFSSKPNNELVHRTSVVLQDSALFQPTRSVSVAGDLTDTFSGSGFFLSDLSDFDTAERLSPEPVFNDLDKLITRKDAEDDLPNIPSSGDVEMSSSDSENEVFKNDLSLFKILVPVSRTKGTLELLLALPTAKISGHVISMSSEYLSSVTYMHAASPTSADIALESMLTAVSNHAASPACNIASASTLPLPFELFTSSSHDIHNQMSFASSDIGTPLNIPTVPTTLLTNTTTGVAYKSSSVDPGLHHRAPDSVRNQTTLSSIFEPSTRDLLSHTPTIPTVSLYAVTALAANEDYIPPDLFSSEHLDLIGPQLHNNDNSQNIYDKDSPSFYENSIPTPVLYWPASPNIARDVTASVFPSSHDLSLVNSSNVKKDIAPATLANEITASSHDDLYVPKMYVSVAAVSPDGEGSGTLTMLSVFSKESSDASHHASPDARMWHSVVDDGLSVYDAATSTPHTETVENVVDGLKMHATVEKDETNLTLNAHSELSQEVKTLPITGSGSRIQNQTTNPSMASYVPPKSPGGTSMLEDNTQAANIPSQNTSDSKWVAFTSDEESGSGQGTSDSLNDNETSTDFSFSDLNERERETEGTIDAGTADLTDGSTKSSPPSAVHGHSAAFNVSEAETSNSSHESRVGLAEGLDSEKKTVVPLVVVSALTFLCLLVLVGILIYWRKCFQTAHFYLEDNTSSRVISTPPAPAFPISDGVGAIPIKRFPKHVAELHARNGFTQEFEEVQSCTVDLGITSDISNHPENKNKNRYINIVAYDHSRVKLSQLAEKDGKVTDYINANYVDGYNRPKAYIAAQGPLKSTAEDFWRMIWEHNVEVIVMITNLVEKGRRKCDQYWPADGSEEYGTYLVTLKSSLVLAYYTVRKFTIRNMTSKKGSQKGRLNEHTVIQYHYTQWPDMGVPDYTLPVLTFVRKAASAKHNSMGPVVVHCSAGVGRTGTYIVLDSMLQQIQREGTVNVFGFLKHIRTQRNYLVQTEEQYIFIHDALVEAILSKETEVLDSHIHSYVNVLLTPGPTGKTRLEKQFKLLSQPDVLQCDYSTALKQHNRPKNRSSAVIPVEQARVGLSSLAGEGTDYINASYIMGYHESNEFIITQHPLLHTVKDFWRMIWDHNAQLVVMLAENQNVAENEFVYWPNKDEPMNCESFMVTMIGEDHVCLSNEEQLVIHDFILEATQDDYVLEVRHFQCPKWPNPDSPISKTFELLRVIAEEASSRDGPVIIHDEFGGVTAGTFCALTTLMHQLETENSMDVYLTAKMINLMRPGVFTDAEQYQFLYKAMLSLVSTRQEEAHPTSLDSNGITLPDGHAAESLESLV
ncbi:receptor-type tyrosine-protein phosphatase zeta isoform X2 [Pleurodeles waltl]|uniref:receptor-type tyrosine-protein phosphatase zeta isoform X2 n=1 Tax=Pleurodeles waltl TaxID=8319 RepID=UPI00370949CE